MRKSRGRGRGLAPSGRKKWLPLAIVVAGLVFVGGAALAVTGGDTSGDAPATSTGPRVQVAQEQFDYGDVAYNTPIETVFRVQNVGDRPLEILGTPRVELVDGC